MNKDLTLHIDELTFSVAIADLKVQPLSYKIIPYIELLIKKLQDSSGNPEVDKLVQYDWAFEAKDAIILLRDGLVKLIKLEQFHKDGLRTAEEVHNFQKKLQSTLHEATYQLLNSYERKRDGQGTISDEWEYQENPLPLVIEQLEEIKDQVKKIQRSQLKLDQLNTKFSDYRASHITYMNQRRDRSTGIQAAILGIKEQVKVYEDPIANTNVTKLLATIEHTIGMLDNHEIFSSYEYIVVEDTDRLNIAVDSQNGQLVSKSVDVLSEISGWNSFNLAAPLKAIDAKLHSYNEKVLAGLFQILNRLKAKLDTGAEDITVEQHGIVMPIERLLKQYREDVTPTVLERLDELEDKLNVHIVPSQLFNEEHLFLPSSTLGQLAGYAEQSSLEKRYSIKNIKSKLSGVLSSIFSKYIPDEQLTTAGTVNKILCFNPESDVNALFLRKGFLGSSFTVDRPEIERRVTNHFKLWQDGYGGSLLIHGGHGSGRSTTIELLPLLFPEVESLHFVLGQKIEINGHTHILDYDLIKAIKFVVKYAGDTRYIVTIDDLEQFSNTPEATYDLVQKLLPLLTKHSRRIYFAVSCHKFLEHHLQEYFDLTTVFTESVSTDNMPTADIEEAVITRAHAVANHEDVLSKSDELSSMARKVSRKANNTVGRAMQLWCMYYNGAYDDSGNRSSFRRTALKHKTLLLTLFRHGKVYEPYLRSMLDEIDQSEMKIQIESLYRRKILTRPEVGYIRINPYLQSTIEAIIK